MRILAWTSGGSFAALAMLAACTTAVETGGDPPVEKAALPCGVADVVQLNCLGCHGAPVRSGAPQPLLTVAEWRAASATDPTQSNGQLSVARMNDPVNPMPPAGMLSPDDIKVVSDWVAAGMTGGDCQPITPDDPILDSAPTCTSMDMWPAPSHFAPGKADDEMFPGLPCIDCHTNPTAYGQNEFGPLYDLGGTIYPSAHEPDNCAGFNGPAFPDVIVHIEDSNGGVWDLKPNAAGNFYLQNSGLVPPYSAKVISAAGVRAMSLKPTSGDCNLCHTENGSNGPDPNGPVAPGRIVPP